MNVMAGPILAGLILVGWAAAAWAQGPRDRECMVGEERIEGECQPITRGPKNRGSGAR
ncbi:MAG TPA: hypothetical protein VEZ16_11365 [Microvirga sp.]|nr:hypothetical protein [Microvirga sp.]